MRTVFKYLNPFKKRMGIGLSIKILGTLVELLLPYILTHILRDVVGSESIGKILLWGSLMILCAALACLCNIVANRMAAKVSRYFSEKMRHDLFERTLYLSASQTDKYTIPSLESRITTDTYHVHNFVGMMQRMGVRAPILLLGGIAITLFMDAHLALVMIATLPIIFICIHFISKRGVPLYSAVQKSTDDMIRVVREDSEGIRVIKALSKNEYENERYDRANRTLVKSETRAGVIMGLTNPIMTLLMNGGITAVVAIAAYRVSGGTSDPETVIAFMQYFTLISMAMMTVSRIFVMYTKCAASAKRIEEILNTPYDLEQICAKDLLEAEEIPHIRFSAVGFSYGGHRAHLENINFDVKRGGSLGIIGATGSGKSTIIKLLMRFYDSDCGTIYINGKDIRSFDKKELTDMFGVALQNDFIYAESVEENIRFGREIPREDVVRAAKIAQADGFISAFPDGYGHLLTSKGTNVSGGQRQRILISRAVAGRPEILVLDDSSSALDYKTDKDLREALSRELSGTTVITVAQRVSSVKGCDLILVVDNGTVIGAGTHEELISDCKEYKEISDSQMGGAFVE